MKAWQFRTYGQYNEVLEWSERALPSPQIGQCLVKTSAVSLNFPDLLVCQGKYQEKAPLPAVPGMEGVGTVYQAGPDSKFKIGDRVVGFCHGGGTLSEYFISDDDSTWLVPNHVTDIQAAALSVTYGTSYFGLFHRGNLKAEETLLVLGGAGGVGSAAIQLAKYAGSKVIAAAGTEAKLAICKKLGADHLINYTNEDMVSSVKNFTNGAGADVIYDPVGGKLFEKTKRCAAWDSRLVIIGFTAGSIPKMETNRVLLKNMSLIGLAWGQYMKRRPKMVESCQEKLYSLLREGFIDPLIYDTLPFSRAMQGLKMIEQREVYGKVVLTI